jgi:hypothetical protein
MQGVGEACKRIQYPLLHFAKIHCLTASPVTPWGTENKWLPLQTPMSYRITSHRLTVVLLAREERESRKGEKSKRQKTRDRTSLAALYSTHWGRLHH